MRRPLPSPTPPPPPARLALQPPPPGEPWVGSEWHQAVLEVYRRPQTTSLPPDTDSTPPSSAPEGGWLARVAIWLTEVIRRR